MGCVRKSFKYRMYPNATTEQKLSWALARCRELYNAGLAERKTAYEFHVKQHPGYYDDETRKRLTQELTVNYYQQKRDLTVIKHEERPEYKELPSHVLQDVLLRLKRAFDNFFRKVELKKQGLFVGNPGYPRFASRTRY